MTRIADMPEFIGAPELADAVADRLGDVEDEVIVLNYGPVLYARYPFAERLLQRLLVEGRARRVDVAGANRQGWGCVSEAAQKLGVADRVEYRAIGRVYSVLHGAS